MKNRKLATGLIASLLAVTPAAMYAEDCCMPEYTPGEPICDGSAGYSQYAGVELDCGWDVYAFGEFLYWRPYRSTTYVALEYATPNVFAAPVDGQNKRSPYLGFRPGFRVGLGMVAHDYDDWIFNIDYTRYHHSFSNTYNVTLPNTLTSTLISLPQFQFLYGSIRNKSHFHYDIVGVNVQRPNYLGQRVILSPFFGLKWLQRNVLIAQDLVGLAGLVDTAQTTLKYSSIGLAGGFDGSWLMCWGFSLIGKADVALLYAYDRSLSVTAVPAVVSAQSPIFRQHKSPRHVDILAKGGMGIGWGSYFCCNRYHVNLSATYDFMGDVSKLDFLSGNMMPNGSVVLMGLTVHGQFDF